MAEKTASIEDMILDYLVTESNNKDKARQDKDEDKTDDTSDSDSVSVDTNAC